MDSTNAEYLIITSESERSVAFEILSPLTKHPGVRVVENNVELKNGFLKKLYRLHYGPLRQWPGHGLWSAKPFNFLQNYRFEANKTCYLVFWSSGYNSVKREMIENLKSDRIKIVLVLWDPVTKRPSKKAFADRDLFDLIFTTEKADADQYGFEYLFQVYSSESSLRHEENETSLYFCGRDKGRKELILRISERMEKLGIGNCKFEIIGSEDPSGSTRDVILMTKKIPYEELLKKAVKSKALLEIVQKGQASTTLRYCEAVCYNKILITNNPNISEYPYYQPQYMHVIQSAEDILPEWFECGEIDYGYAGEFEPEMLLKRIADHFRNDS